MNAWYTLLVALCSVAVSQTLPCAQIPAEQGLNLLKLNGTWVTQHVLLFPETLTEESYQKIHENLSRNPTLTETTCHRETWNVTLHDVTVTGHVQHEYTVRTSHKNATFKYEGNSFGYNNATIDYAVDTNKTQGGIILQMGNDTLEYYVLLLCTGEEVKQPSKVALKVRTPLPEVETSRIWQRTLETLQLDTEVSKRVWQLGTFCSNA